MNFEIYSLEEKLNAVEWEKKMTFGNPANNEAALYFPKVFNLQSSKNLSNDLVLKKVYVFCPEFYIRDISSDTTNLTDLSYFCEIWDRNFTRLFTENIPITLNRDIGRLRILQI